MPATRSNGTVTFGRATPRAGLVLRIRPGRNVSAAAVAPASTWTRAVVGREVVQRVKNGLASSPERRRDLRRCLRHWPKARLCTPPALEHAGRRFFSGFDAGLMVGVDIDERAVESDRALVERDQRADGERA